MRKAICRIVVILFVAATLCACSSDEFPTGIYTRPDDVVEYRDDGKFSLTIGVKVATEGTYSIQDDEIHYTTDSWCDEVNAGPATYKWKHEDGRLSFEVIGEDLCEGRRMMHSVNWFGPK
mgnify:CR=1 FL=1